MNKKNTIHAGEISKNLQEQQFLRDEMEQLQAQIGFNSSKYKKQEIKLELTITELETEKAQMRTKYTDEITSKSKEQQTLRKEIEQLKIDLNSKSQSIIQLKTENEKKYD